jgi:hypothetical protein
VIAARLAPAAALALWLLQGAGVGAARMVEGRVTRPVAVHSPAVPIAGAWVVLHRVGSDTAHPLDSVRTDADGRYRIAYRAFGVADAIYFLAVRHDGVAYFSAPLQGARVTGPDAGITVYDTSSAGEPLHERGRHVIVFAPGADGTRKVVEVYELENTGITTRVAAGFADPVWRAAIPEAASGFQAGESDVSAASIIGGSGKVDVFAPLAPGLKQVTFTYSLPSGAFPLTLPPARDSLVFEVLLEEPGAEAAGAGLKRTDSVTVNGHHLSRWLSPNAPRNAVARIGGAPRRDRMTYAVTGLVIAMGGAMLAALIIGRRRGG